MLKGLSMTKVDLDGLLRPLVNQLHTDFNSFGMRIDYQAKLNDIGLVSELKVMISIQKLSKSPQHPAL